MPALGKERVSVLENKLVDAAFRGNWVGPPRLPDPLSGGHPNITVRGSFVRKLLLGLIRSPAVAGQDPRVGGVRLRGAVIKGEIDLSDCTGIRGAPLPPLLLEYCVIDGTTVNDIPIAIDASNARIYRLSLNRCRIAGRIDLTLCRT